MLLELSDSLSPLAQAGNIFNLLISLIFLTERNYYFESPAPWGKEATLVKIKSSQPYPSRVVGFPYTVVMDGRNLPIASLASTKLPSCYLVFGRLLVQVASAYPQFLTLRPRLVQLSLSYCHAVYIPDHTRLRDTP